MRVSPSPHDTTTMPHINTFPPKISRQNCSNKQPSPQATLVLCASCAHTHTHKHPTTNNLADPNLRHDLQRPDTTLHHTALAGTLAKTSQRTDTDDTPAQVTATTAQVNHAMPIQQTPLMLQPQTGCYASLPCRHKTAGRDSSSVHHSCTCTSVSRTKRSGVACIHQLQTQNGAHQQRHARLPLSCCLTPRCSTLLLNSSILDGECTASAQIKPGGF